MHTHFRVGNNATVYAHVTLGKNLGVPRGKKKGELENLRISIPVYESEKMHWNIVFLLAESAKTSLPRGFVAQGVWDFLFPENILFVG